MRVQPRNRMRENCTSGTARGALGNRRSYRGVRQAKLGVSCRVKDLAGEGRATHPYRVLRMSRRYESIERSIRSVHREPWRPQGNSHCPEVWYSLGRRMQADGDGGNEPEANTKEATGRASGGSAGVLRAWHAWREAWRTWETLEVPASPGTPHPTTRREG